MTGIRPLPETVVRLATDPLKNELICDWCPGKNWCKHIEMIVQAHGDTATNKLLDPSVRMVDVPIQPSKNIWSKVTWDLEEVVPGTYLAYLMSATLPEVGAVKLGLFTPANEGRKILRMLVLDQFDAVTRGPDFRCRSGLHDMNAENIWRLLGRTSGERSFVPKWSVFSTGTCLYCHNKAGTTDMSDLIPDVSSGKRWKSVADDAPEWTI